jgi:hypothetical protein
MLVDCASKNSTNDSIFPSGKCNFDKGQCECPFGWTFDADIGPCGRLQVNTSSWGGIGRCPGIVPPNSGTSRGHNMNGRQNYNSRVYVSINPSYNEVETKVPAGVTNRTNNHTISGEELFDV